MHLPWTQARLVPHFTAPLPHAKGLLRRSAGTHMPPAKYIISNSLRALQLRETDQFGGIQSCI